MRPRAETLLTAPAGSRLPGAARTRRQRRGDADGAAGRAPRQQGAPPPTCLCPAPRGPSRAGLCMLQLLAGVRAGGGSPPGRAPLGAPRESRLSPLRPPRRPSLCPAGAAEPLCIPHRVSAAPAAGEPLPRRPRWGTAAPSARPPRHAACLASVSPEPPGRARPSPGQEPRGRRPCRSLSFDGGCEAAASSRANLAPRHPRCSAALLACLAPAVTLPLLSLAPVVCLTLLLPGPACLLLRLLQ